LLHLGRGYAADRSPQRVPVAQARGTSAHRQLKIYETAMQAGASGQEGLEAVIDWLIAETALLD